MFKYKVVKELFEIKNLISSSNNFILIVLKAYFQILRHNPPCSEIQCGVEITIDIFKKIDDIKIIKISLMCLARILYASKENSNKILDLIDIKLILDYFAIDEIRQGAMYFVDFILRMKNDPLINKMISLNLLEITKTYLEPKFSLLERQKAIIMFGRIMRYPLYKEMIIQNDIFEIIHKIMNEDNIILKESSIKFYKKFIKNCNCNQFKLIQKSSIIKDIVELLGSPNYDNLIIESILFISKLIQRSDILQFDSHILDELIELKTGEKLDNLSLNPKYANLLEETQIITKLSKFFFYKDYFIDEYSGI